MIHTALHSQLISEVHEMERFAIMVEVCTNEPRTVCIEFVKKVPRSFRVDVRIALSEGLSINDCEKIISNTMLSALWRLNFAGRDVVRAILGIPTIGEMT